MSKPDGVTGIDERRISDVAFQLNNALDEKVLGVDPRLALARFEDAYAMAIASPCLPPPFPQIAAYRLGHMRLRFAATYEELLAIRELFREAEQLGRAALGPLPLLYQLAVEHRLAFAAEDKQRRSQHLECQCNLFRQLHTAQPPALSPEIDPKLKSLVQGAWHNYLEIAAYFSGEPYEAQGFKSPTGDLAYADEWRVIGTHGVDHELNLRFSKSMARQAVRGREEADAADVFFELDAIELGETGRLWRTGYSPIPVNLRQLKLLVALCLFDPSQVARIRSFVLGATEEAGTRITDIQSRLKRNLQKLGFVDVFTKPEANSIPGLNPGLRVVGLAHWKSIEVSAPSIREWEERSHR